MNLTLRTLICCLLAGALALLAGSLSADWLGISWWSRLLAILTALGVYQPLVAWQQRQEARRG